MAQRCRRSSYCLCDFVSLCYHCRDKLQDSTVFFLHRDGSGKVKGVFSLYKFFRLYKVGRDPCRHCSHQEAFSLEMAVVFSLTSKVPLRKLKSWKSLESKLFLWMEVSNRFFNVLQTTIVSLSHIFWVLLEPYNWAPKIFSGHSLNFVFRQWSLFFTLFVHPPTKYNFTKGWHSLLQL